jgi:hypothetical protein
MHMSEATNDACSLAYLLMLLLLLLL